MGALLALASAFTYGIVDFTGGLLSRRVPHATVTLLGQVGGLLLATGAALLLPADTVAGTCCGAPCPASAAPPRCASSTVASVMAR